MSAQNDWRVTTRSIFRHPKGGCRLYLITPPQLTVKRFLPPLEAALAAGDVACVQLRLKGAAGAPAPARVWLDASRRIAPVLRRHGALFVLNDRVELVRACGADGAHVGARDMPLAAARAQLGEDAVLGVSCGASRARARAAAVAGADYVAFGSFYPSSTKASPHRPRPAILRWWRSTSLLPSVAIGGIVPTNAAPLIAAGADFLAVSQGVWGHAEGAAAAVADFTHRMGQGSA